MHDLIRFDYLNEVVGLTGFLALRFLGDDLNDVYIDDDDLDAFVKEYRAHYKIRTVKERYFDPQSLRKIAYRLPYEQGFEEWASKNSNCINQLDELVFLLNTTNDMAEFRGAYNEMWSCLRQKGRSCVSLCEIKPSEPVQRSVKGIQLSDCFKCKP